MKMATQYRIAELLIEELKIILGEVKVTQDSDEIMLYLSKSYNEKVKQLDNILEKLFRFDKKKHLKLDTYYLNFRFSSEYKEVIKRLEYWSSVNDPEAILRDINREIDLINKYLKDLEECSNVSEANKIAYNIRQLQSYIKKNKTKMKKLFSYSDKELEKKVKYLDEQIMDSFKECKVKFN